MHNLARERTYIKCTLVLDLDKSALYRLISFSISQSQFECLSVKKTNEFDARPSVNLRYTVRASTLSSTTSSTPRSDSRISSSPTSNL